MDRHPRLLAFALCVSALAPAAVPAQTPAPSAAAQQKPAAKKPKGEAADPMAEVRRASAVSLVSSLADEARTFSEPALRARVQARSADALWETDKEKARQLFRRAWEAAEAADRDTANLSEEERRRRAGRGRRPRPAQPAPRGRHPRLPPRPRPGRRVPREAGRIAQRGDVCG